jgi:prepilin-type N-terminal cleavage/methylation domain-containing protein
MSHRRGFTLVEVLIALVILGGVTGAIYQLLQTSQRLSLAQAEQTSLQSNVRTGSLVVPNELRELNTVSGTLPGDQNDVIVADDDGIEYRAMRGLGFVCQAPGAGELRLARSSWTGLRDPDSQRDDIYVFIDAEVNEDEDDTWLRVDLTGATATANACNGASPGFTLTAAAMPNVPVNTPVRLFERVELRLYADNGDWWLGARSVKVAGAALQPVLGPLTNDGFALEYLDSNGNDATGDLSTIKSIRLTVQGLTDDPVRAGGTGAMGHPEKTLVTDVLLRNSVRP